jgi:hypothetical protein
MAFYYSAINKLFNRRFEAADVDLLRSWTLSRGAKDLRPSIIDAMSLSAFLSQKSLPVFQGRLPKKYWPRRGASFDLWDLDKPESPNFGSKFYMKLASDIKRERTIRILADLERLTSRANFSQIASLAGVATESPLLNRFRGAAVVTFSEPLLAERLEEELANVTKLSSAPLSSRRGTKP